MVRSAAQFPKKCKKLFLQICKFFFFFSKLRFGLSSTMVYKSLVGLECLLGWANIAQSPLSTQKVFLFLSIYLKRSAEVHQQWGCGLSTFRYWFFFFFFVFAFFLQGFAKCEEAVCFFSRLIFNPNLTSEIEEEKKKYIKTLRES